jgi:uncharacterized protein (DUF2342 family)
MGPMLRWFVFTMGMGLLPFGFSVLLQVLRGVPPERWQSSPELLFFSVMVSASQLDGISTSLASPAREGEGGSRGLLSAMFGLFLLCAITTAALYGVYADMGRNDPARVVGSTCVAVVAQASIASESAMREHCTEWLSFQHNLFTLSMWMAGGLGLMGTLTEWARTRRQ